MELTKTVAGWGNSAGVLLPREWLGKQVQIILIDRSSEIKKEVLDILDPYLEDILGIYLVGSYARGDYEKNSDIDIIAISKEKKEEIKSGNYNLSIIPLDVARNTLNKDPIQLLPRLLEAKTIINNSLLIELKNIKVDKSKFKEFLDGTKRMIKINKEVIELDKLDSDILESKEIIYSMILRLRGILLIKNILNEEKYYKKGLLKILEKNLGDEYMKVYNIYKDYKEDRKNNQILKLATAEKLLKLLKNELNTIKW